MGWDGRDHWRRGPRIRAAGLATHGPEDARTGVAGALPFARHVTAATLLTAVVFASLAAAANPSVEAQDSTLRASEMVTGVADGGKRLSRGTSDGGHAKAPAFGGAQVRSPTRARAGGYRIDGGWTDVLRRVRIDRHPDASQGSTDAGAANGDRIVDSALNRLETKWLCDHRGRAGSRRWPGFPEGLLFQRSTGRVIRLSKRPIRCPASLGPRSTLTRQFCPALRPHFPRYQSAEFKPSLLVGGRLFEAHANATTEPRSRWYSSENRLTLKLSQVMRPLFLTAAHWLRACRIAILRHSLDN